MTAANQSNFAGPERRRFQRVEITLSGRYMLRDRHEYPCWTTNMSPAGIAMLGLEKGLIGEPVIAYIDKIGRIEGLIARNFDRCFAIAVQLPGPKREKLNQTLSWLVSHQTQGAPDKRVHERIKPYRRRTTLTVSDGTQYPAALIDLSLLGAAINVETDLPIGAPVVVGQIAGRVVRRLPAGVAVRFDAGLDAESFDEDIRI